MGRDDYNPKMDTGINGARGAKKPTGCTLSCMGCLGIIVVVIVAFFTVLLVLGTQLSSRVGSVFTVIKVAIVLFVIVVGFFFVKASNYTPFVPASQPRPAGEGDVDEWNGDTGVLMVTDGD